MVFGKAKSLTVKYSGLSDEQLLDQVFMGTKDAIVYFFYQKYLSVFQYHIYKLFPPGTDIGDLVDEFFLYLYENDWRRLRTFNGKASLNTWISIISFRFFRNYKHAKVDSNGLITVNDKWELFTGDWVQEHEAGFMMDLKVAIAGLPNDRDKSIAELLLLQDKDPKTVADSLGMTVDYLYTVKNRVIKQIKRHFNN